MNQFIGLWSFSSLIAGTVLAFFYRRAQERDVASLIQFSEGPGAQTLLLYKALTLQTQHAFHALLALATGGGWLIPWWCVASANSALIRALEKAAVQLKKA